MRFARVDRPTSEAAPPSPTAPNPCQSAMLTSWRPWRGHMVSFPDLAVLQRFKSSQPLAGTVYIQCTREKGVVCDMPQKHAVHGAIISSHQRLIHRLRPRQSACHGCRELPSQASKEVGNCGAQTTLVSGCAGCTDYSWTTLRPWPMLWQVAELSSSRVVQDHSKRLGKYQDSRIALLSARYIHRREMSRYSLSP